MQASAGQKEQFRALAAAQLPRLYGLARRLVGDDAEDAVQDCLLKAYRGYGRLGDEMAGPAWLTSILVNCCRDRGRGDRPAHALAGWPGWPPTWPARPSSTPRCCTTPHTAAWSG